MQGGPDSSEDESETEAPPAGAAKPAAAAKASKVEKGSKGEKRIKSEKAATVTLHPEP